MLTIRCILISRIFQLILLIVSCFFWYLKQLLFSKFVPYYCLHYIIPRILHIISRKSWYLCRQNHSDGQFQKFAKIAKIWCSRNIHVLQYIFWLMTSLKWYMPVICVALLSSGCCFLCIDWSNPQELLYRYQQWAASQKVFYLCVCPCVNGHIQLLRLCEPSVIQNIRWNFIKFYKFSQLETEFD